eukprot:CAMPEP_0167793088 /NCGR_PEP_ID=MMETSP0111_2-20121227/12959_1 /TAXON_ID=91324 /ORGANISM="Lotharella globosa, Strain CCCM811" /LENGTH=127 /DNA_ID=CAMNT_0007686153 /DNA_START=763 /DNA_END=1145 /DNA_ORIENTATION=+
MAFITGILESIMVTAANNGAITHTPESAAVNFVTLVWSEDVHNEVDDTRTYDGHRYHLELQDDLKSVLNRNLSPNDEVDDRPGKPPNHGEYGCAHAATLQKGNISVEEAAVVGVDEDTTEAHHERQS